MTPQFANVLYVTVYAMDRAALGGAAWVDTRIRRAAAATSARVEEFLVNDPESSTSIDLELRANVVAKARTLARMIALREPYIIAKFRQSPNWRKRARQMGNAWTGQTIVTSQWPALLLATDAGLRVDHHIAHNVDYRLSEIYDPFLFRVLSNSDRTRRAEIRTLRRAAALTTLSVKDGDLLSKLQIKSTHLNLAPVNTERRHAKPLRRIGFIGKAAWPPNASALARLQNEVMPRLRELMPDNSPALLIAGKGTENLKQPGTICLGAIESVEEFYNQIDLVVVPRGEASSGISVKILEAWEQGVNVIAPPALLTAIGVSPDDAASDLEDSNSLALQIRDFYGRDADNERVNVVPDLTRGSLTPSKFWHRVIATEDGTE
ncbi:hypothetical protein MTE01_20390 [Microbacterium testaceum]|uniref:Glycosyltransferase n=1 Tax=Microbacterium testaceum TaxID=2033 RepID=A0A4Y3QLG5_MICTE|nr:glycosyltransferase family 4 protein [Microbacterium testaceum]GEB46094.1 hypothetical protein MTE01_20390 [Microbacterium testaceum]